MSASRRWWVLVLALGLPAAVAAQEPCDAWGCGRAEIPGSVVDARLAAANAGLGTISAVVSALLHRERVSWKTAALGGVGGLLIFGGKKITAARFDGSGLIGRQVGGLGGSIVYDVGRGEAPLHTVGLAFGPARVVLVRGRPPHFYVDGASLLGAAYFAVSGRGARLDVGGTLSSGALVFVSREPGLWGEHVGAAVLLPGRQDIYDERLLLSHETVHVIQSDQIYWWVTKGADERVGELLVPAAWGRHLTLGVDAALLGAAGQLFDYSDRPWEIEAYRITRQWR